MWVARPCRRSLGEGGCAEASGWIPETAPLPSPHGRELREAAAGAVQETGGICHVVGCRSLKRTKLTNYGLTPSIELHGEKALDGVSEVDLDPPSQGGFGGAGSTGCGWPARPAVALANADVSGRSDEH